MAGQGGADDGRPVGDPPHGSDEPRHRVKTASGRDRVFTIPNALSLLRLLLVPVFAVLILARLDGWALLVLMFSGFTDWLDGWLARKWDQQTRLGELLDPAADRLYILATLLGLAWREVVPWWLVVAIVARDVTPRPLQPMADAAFYRIAQEALSNARQHAPGAAVSLDLEWTGDAVSLSVVNAAGGAADRGGTGGQQGRGLLGMRERAQLIGADLRVGPTPDGGFGVHLHLDQHRHQDQERRGGSWSA